MLQEVEEHCRAQEEERLAAGQDLDVRRMELEAQRRRLEQVISFRLPAFSIGQIPSPRSPLVIPLYFLLEGKTILYSEYFKKIVNIKIHCLNKFTVVFYEFLLT